MTKSTPKQFEDQIDKIIKTAQIQTTTPNIGKHIKRSLGHSKLNLIKKSLVSKNILGKKILKNPYPYVALTLVAATAATTMGLLITKKINEKEKGFFDRLLRR